MRADFNRPATILLCGREDKCARDKGGLSVNSINDNFAIESIRDAGAKFVLKTYQDGSQLFAFLGKQRVQKRKKRD